MNRIISYNIKNQLRRTSTLILLGILSLMIVLIKVVFSSSSTVMNLVKEVSNSLFFLSEKFFIDTFYFGFGIIFISSVVISIYKQSKENGTNILLINKPYSRAELIYGKLLSVGILILLFSFATFAINYSTSFIENDSNNNRILNSLSLFISEILVSIIFGSIVILISYLTKSSVLIYASASFAILIPTSSIAISLVSDVDFKNARTYTYKEYSSTNLDSEEIYLNLSNEPNEYPQSEELKTRNSDLYKKLVYIDPWYQLSGLYSMFHGDGLYSEWISEKMNPSSVISIGNNEINLLFSKSSLDKSLTLDYANLIKSIASSQELMNNLSSTSSAISNLEFERQLIFMNWLIIRGTRTTTISEINKRVQDIRDLSNSDAIHSFHMNTTNSSYSLLKELTKNNIFNLSSNVLHNTSSPIEPNSNVILLFNNETIDIYKKQKYIDTKYLVSFWTLIAIALLGSVQFIEFKRELLK